MSQKIYEEITNQIIVKLENGVIPWIKPWLSEMPQNYITKKKYRGMNAFLLNLMEFESPYWMTFKQAVDKGFKIKKGSKSQIVIFWNWVEKKEEEGTVKKVPFLKYYRVFNLEQMEGFEAIKEDKNIIKINEDADANCTKILNKFFGKIPVINHGFDGASYSPCLDLIRMPAKEKFFSTEYYFAILFHEIIHSTGHSSRLNRLTEAAHFGTGVYAKEELVADLGASFLCGVAGIAQPIIENSAAYIQGWLKALKNDHKLLIQAAAQAQKAVDFLIENMEEADEE